MNSRRQYVGESVPRKEDDRLLRGTARFIDDLPEPAGTLFLAFLRSPHPHALIRNVTTRGAAALPGVVAVYTGSDIAAWTKPMISAMEPGSPGLSRPNMAVDRVRHVGETVAAVVALDPYIAEDALELIDVDYDPQPPLVTIEDAMRANALSVHDYLSSNVVAKKQHAVEGTDDVFARADHVVSDTFWSSRLAAIPIEPRGFVADFDNGQSALTFHGPTQMPHKLRWELADALGLAETKVRVIVPDVGGAFGMKSQTYPEDIAGAAISRRLGRPVKWVQDRQDDLISSTQARDYRFDVELALTHDGVIQGLRADIVVNIGAYATWLTSPGIEAGGAGLFMIGPYKLNHYSYRVASVVTHKAPVGVYRGVAAPICTWSVEMLLDRAARDLRIDPIDLRRRNLVKPADLPYVNAIGVTYDTASHEACLDRALELSGYETIKASQSRDTGADPKFRGVGVACITEHTGQGSSRMRARGQAARSPGFDGASVRMEPDGKVIGYVSHTTQGQGHLTVFAQLIADELGVDIDDVTIEESDTALMPFGTGTVASRGAVSGGGAVIGASRKIAAKLRRIAAHAFEASPADVVLANGRASIAGVADLSIDVRELAAAAYMVGPGTLPPDEAFGLDAVDFYDPPTSSYSNATHIACVAVDKRTGLITVEKYYVVHDCGRILNPMIVDGQVQGGIAQGLGSALMKSMEYSDDGQPLTTTLLDYIIPTTLDVPDIVVEHIQTPSTTTLGGMKGAGEGGVIGAVSAISLATADALSAFNPKITRLPLTPKAVLGLMRTQRFAGPA